jgi:peptidoglycan/LPS O-acetylase OafA/YrhL
MSIDPQGGNTVKKQMFTSLQGARGIASLLIVLYHCEDVGSLDRYWGWSHHYFNFGVGSLYFFFMLSGVVILHAHKRDIGVPARLRNYASKRLRRVYPVYWVYLLPLIAMYFVIPSFGSGYERNPIAILQSFLLIAISNFPPINPVAWTLYHEVLFYFVFAFMLWNRTVGRLLLGMWMVASVIALISPPQNSLLDFYISPLHLLFGLGMLVSEGVRRLSWRGSPFAIPGFAMLAACCVYADLVRSAAAIFPIVFGICSAITVFGLMLMEKRKPIFTPKFFLFLGDASYSIYLVHFTVIEIAIRPVFRLWRMHPVPTIIPFLALFVISLAGGILAYLYIELPLMKIMSKRLDKKVAGGPLTVARAVPTATP